MTPEACFIRHTVLPNGLDLPQTWCRKKEVQKDLQTNFVVHSTFSHKTLSLPNEYPSIVGILYVPEHYSHLGVRMQTAGALFLLQCTIHPPILPTEEENKSGSHSGPEKREFSIGHPVLKSNVHQSCQHFWLKLCPIFYLSKLKYKLTFV